MFQNSFSTSILGKGGGFFFNFDILSGIQVNIFFAVSCYALHGLSLQRVCSSHLKALCHLAMIEHYSQSSCHQGACDFSGLWQSYSSSGEKKKGFFLQETQRLCSPFSQYYLSFSFLLKATANSYFSIICNHVPL